MAVKPRAVTAVLPRIGGYLVAAWLLTIIANLLIKAEYYDIACVISVWPSGP